MRRREQHDLKNLHERPKRKRADPPPRPRATIQNGHGNETSNPPLNGTPECVRTHKLHAMLTFDSVCGERGYAELEDRHIRRPSLAVLVENVTVRLRLRVRIDQVRVFVLEFLQGEAPAHSVEVIHKCLGEVGQRGGANATHFYVTSSLTATKNTAYTNPQRNASIGMLFCVPFHHCWSSFFISTKHAHSVTMQALDGVR